MVALSLRNDDLLEVVLKGLNAFQALEFSRVHSESYAVLNDGVPVGLFGCSARGQLWMLGTDLLTANRRELIAGAREFIDRWSMTYDELWNYVPTFNTNHINFLKHLGADFMWHSGYGRFSIVRSVLSRPCYFGGSGRCFRDSRLCGSVPSGTAESTLRE